ncbi:inositol polyphosphate 5-phosphatase E-like [Daphnia carinata]|uniref:inositol polyphosphate 5-phosphatase E-like n=1 Tax=Daphnia carinata TaxID=120202 RepID=UPI00257EB88E|nr:inositol polyphosphate 5-phosphatase E-like [Daphnia carinata]
MANNQPSDPIARVRSIDSQQQVTGESSRCNSRRNSFSCSNRGSVSCLEEALSSVVGVLQLSASQESLNDEFKPESEIEIAAIKVCNSCKEENQVQQALSVQLARQRSYLHGSVGPYQSLLGITELKRTLSDSQLKIFIGTWNMNGKTPPSTLEDLLLPTPLQSLHDVVVIGTQETNGERDEWEVGLQETLGPGHVLFHSVELGTIHMAVFLRRDLIWVCSVPESDTHSTRAGSAFRTKGGVAIGFSIFGTSLLFVNCHLPAHAEKVAERERDLKKIFLSLDLPKELPIRKKQRDVTSNYDLVFICGDMNFRINKPREEVIDIVSKTWVDPSSPCGRGLTTLMEADQLKFSLKNNRILKTFNEANITFPPTYKYIPGTGDFDEDKQRIPSYTDRILWKERKGAHLRCAHYDVAKQLKSSDHTPVWAAFKVPIKPGRETIPLSAGTFNRPVYLEGMRRRLQAWDPNKASLSNSASCSLQ